MFPDLFPGTGVSRMLYFPHRAPNIAMTRPSSRAVEAVLEDPPVRPVADDDLHSSSVKNVRQNGKSL